MSLRRFKFLLRYIHFTNSCQFKVIDQDKNFNEIEEIVEKFTQNCEKNFTLSSDITVSKKCLDHVPKSDRRLNGTKISSGLVIYFIMDSNFCYISTLKFFDAKKLTDFKEDSITHENALLDILRLQKKSSHVMLDKSCQEFKFVTDDSNPLSQQIVENTLDFTTDEILNKYSMFKHTNRLILKLCIFMIDIACLNSFVTYHTNVNHALSRKEFLKQLGLALVKNQIKNRATCQYLPKELRDQAANYLSLKFVSKTFDKRTNKPIRCVLCPRKADKKVRTFCSKSEKPMCQSHLLSICTDCV